MSKTEKIILMLFPHQLFLAQHFPNDIDEVHIIEDPLFFGDDIYPCKFHKHKLVFHRASIDHYRNYLDKTNCTVVHHRYQTNSTTATLLGNMSHIQCIYYFDVADYELERRVRQGAGNTPLNMLPSPSFLNTREENAELLPQDKKPRMSEYYKHMRRKCDILIDTNGEPTGGQWSYDDANRKKIPKNKQVSIPADPVSYTDYIVDQAISWTEDHFANNPGNLSHYWCNPTRAGALETLKEFVHERYKLFGDYEDAIDSTHWRLWHSTLSPYLNCGLLTPEEVIGSLREAYDTHDIPLNAHEGYIRQIIGWREYMRAVYNIYGVSLRTANHWQHEQSLGSAWYTANTGLCPLDTALTHTINYAYNHHIERLMVIGNAMFLSRIHPDEVYKWFMEMYLDAYDWVMVGNVYGMSQDTIDGLITTKPYFSGSNYICNMSDYSKSEDWCETWDALYWSFIIEHEEALKGNYRWGMMLAHVYKMDPDKQESYIQNKNDFLKSLS